MQKKIMTWKTKGMNRDMSVSSFNPEFSFENKNLRLSTNEGNTTISWVNERGTKILRLISMRDYDGSMMMSNNIEGVAIGAAVLNHTLVLFIHDELSNTYPDSIYVIDKSNKTSYRGKRIFRGNLNFSIEHPLETLVSYEADNIQKVYWTDGLNQPRLINIADTKNVSKWNAFGKNLCTFFDFIPTYDMDDKVTVELLQSSGGLFAPGVIQYCFTYINKHGQQSNIVYVSTLYYLSHTDRGAAADDMVTSTFKITIKDADTNFDYIRLYSIQRTSIDDTPIVKILEDLIIEPGKDVSYIDTGTTGSSMDPTELLFVGGREISALTMADKDGTLFLGNLKQKNIVVDSIQDYFRDNQPVIEYKNDDSNKAVSLGADTNTYFYKSSLSKNRREITTFKGGEWYRFGIQLQKKNGEWTEPIHIGDEQNMLYPSTSFASGIANMVYAQSTIDIDAVAEAYCDAMSITKSQFYNIFAKVRPVIVYPTIGDRSVLCQGVLNPTVFNIEDRKDNTPFAQPSWFFRPYNNGNRNNASDVLGISTTNSWVITPVIEVPEPFKSKGVLQYYIIKARVRTDKIQGIIDSGIITCQYKIDASTEYKETKRFTLSSVILLSEQSEWNEYAFLSTDAFYLPGNRMESRSIYNVEYDINLEHPQFCVRDIDGSGTTNYESTQFPIYSGLRKNGKYMYYANTDSLAENAPIYQFEFYLNMNEYGELYNGTNSCNLFTVNFSSVEEIPAPISINEKGDFVAFKHYDSLYTDEEAYKSVANTRQVEIQGSKKEYNTPFEASKETKSNAQYFIDQSIITLNSPDIEFDTEVQNYGTDNLHLRIVGAIPITSTASSHKIRTSSMMLETNYGSEGSKLRTFGIGERNINVVSKNYNVNAYRRLISELLWNDAKYSVEVEGEETIVTTDNKLQEYMVYPWHRTGPLNNDPRSSAEAAAMLQTKIESNIWFSENTEYFTNHNTNSVVYSKVGVQIALQENDFVMNYRLPKQRQASSDINYYANIDKVLVNSEGYNIKYTDYLYSSILTMEDKSTDPISIKYKSGTHAAISLSTIQDVSQGDIPILPYARTSSDGSVIIGKYDNIQEPNITFWEDRNLKFTQSEVDIRNYFGGIQYGFLWLGEIYKDTPVRFGGDDKNAILNNKWTIAGDDVLFSAEDNEITIKWTEGDTYYQRYDCLKTFPFTEDDTNQVVEILSFMCETHINIDGRYDRNRGQIDNTNMRPRNFNLLNPVYSQKNNFFISRKVDTDGQKELSYPNQVYYSKTKQSGADVDLWTNVTLASMLELDGDKGQLNAIERLNDQLIAFQDSGVSQILYNESVQVATQQGVPIEIANSGKVQGKRYITNTIGCSNKWSMVTTPMGIYFMDSNDKGIYLFNGQLSNLSVSQGFNSWAKQNIPSSDVKWNSYDFDNFVAYYDKQNQDVLFINRDTALAFSEKYGCFTSFYDYQGTPYLCSLDDVGIWIKTVGNNTMMYQHQAGDYCDFFGVKKPYSMTLIGNQEPQTDKIFSNIDLRATSFLDGEYADGKFLQNIPFDNIEVWDDYQHGISALRESNGVVKPLGYQNDESTLVRKFRMWRCDIPRDNAPIALDIDKNITRDKAHPMNRMRNPWLYLKLSKETSEENIKTEIHDIAMTFFS